MTSSTITAVGCGTPPEPPQQPVISHSDHRQHLIERGTYLLEYSHLVIEDLIRQQRIADAVQLQSSLEQCRTDFTLAVEGVLPPDVVVVAIDAAICIAEAARQKSEEAR